MKKLVAIVGRCFFWIALVAVCCAIVGGYMLFDIQSNGSLITEPLEPIWRGIKTLWGIDGYKYKLSDLKTWHQYVGYVLYEFGRILGFLVFFRAMASLISTSFSTLKARHKVMRGIKRGENVVAVHGDSSYADVLIRNLTNRGMTVTFSDKRLLNHLGADYAGDLQELSLTLAVPS